MRLLILIITLLTVTAPVAGDSVSMIAATDLRQEARIARDRNLLLVIEFSSEYCAFCRKLEALFLMPMQRNDEYNDKVLIRTVSLDAYETLIDFQGRSISTSEFASRYDVSMTPTLLFLNGEGVEMSEKLVGIWSEDFYGGFIDNRIDEARARL
jgi:thioredoxin-related protein